MPCVVVGTGFGTAGCTVWFKGFGLAMPCVVVGTTEGFDGTATGFGLAMPCVVVGTATGFGGGIDTGFGDGLSGIVAVDTVLDCGACPIGIVAVDTVPSASGVAVSGLSLIVFLAAEEAMDGVAAGTLFKVPVSVFLSFSGSLRPPLSLLGVFSLMISILFSQPFHFAQSILNKRSISIIQRNIAYKTGSAIAFFRKIERNIQKICYFIANHRKMHPFHRWK